MLVDGTNIAMRAIHATSKGRAPLSAVVGKETVPTAALLVFLNMLSKYTRHAKPTHLVVCWDSPFSSAFRRRIDPSYKVSRKSKVPGAPDAIDQIKHILELFGIAQAQAHAVEADDLIAGYWHLHRRRDDVLILSGDKDFLQLVGRDGDGSTVQIRPGSNPEWWSAEVVERSMGCSPEYLPFVMALAGDSSDDVPGLRGVGTKTAVKMMHESGWDFDALMDRGHPKIGGEDERERVRNNLRLVRLREYLPEDDPMPAMLPAPLFSPTYNNPRLMELLVSLQIESLMEPVRSGVFFGMPRRTGSV